MVIEHFEQEGTILEGYHSHASKILRLMFESEPVLTWEAAAGFLSEDDEAGLSGPRWATRFRLERWLHDSEVLAVVPHAEIIAWIENARNDRAPLVAHIVPRDLEADDPTTSLTLIILEKYGHLEPVCRALYANYRTETWGGPASLHYMEVQERLRSVKGRLREANAIRWIDRYVRDLDEIIQQAKIDEERRGF